MSYVKPGLYKTRDGRKAEVFAIGSILEKADNPWAVGMVDGIWIEFWDPSSGAQVEGLAARDLHGPWKEPISHEDTKDVSITAERLVIALDAAAFNLNNDRDADILKELSRVITQMSQNWNDNPPLVNIPLNEALDAVNKERSLTKGELISVIKKWRESIVGKPKHGDLVAETANAVLAYELSHLIHYLEYA